MQRYAVDLDVTGGDDVFGSTTTVSFTCTRPGAATFVELTPTTLHRAILNGEDLDLSTLDGNRLPLPDLAARNELEVMAELPYSHTGEGLHHYRDPADGEVYVAAQCGLDNAQRVFAAFDQPDLKAVLDVSVTTRPGWTVVGNGITSRAKATADRWVLTPTPPVSTYLFAAVAGPLHVVRAEHGGLPLSLQCRRSLAAHLDREADEMLAITRSCLDRFAEIFDEPYPFDSYDQVFIPELNWGAMENVGCVTFREEYLFPSTATDVQRQTRGIVMAHEMAHMWFGNLVTLQWWDDVWLNESFAEYMGYRVLAELSGLPETVPTGTWTDFAVARKTGAYDADQRPSTHAVSVGGVPTTEAALSAFDNISYAKGASALRQLVAWLGDDAFLAGVNAHITAHRFGNATLGDLLAALDAASERDVHAWADRWLATTGVDLLRAERVGRDVLRISHGGTRPHRLGVGRYVSTGTGAAAPLRGLDRIFADVPADAAHVDVDLSGDEADVVLLNDGDLSYCKVRMDARSWSSVTAGLHRIADPLGRAVVWSIARDMVRDGDLPAAEYLALVCRHLPFETDTAVVGGVLPFARYDVADRYLHPPERIAALQDLARVCSTLLTSATSVGRGGLRLEALRGLIAGCSTPEESARLRRWLTSGDPVDGLVLEPDLRWRILLRLCVLGLADENDVDAERRRDSSAEAVEGAARCRAALPTAAAKEAAWSTVFGGIGERPAEEVSTYVLTATLQGFWQPEHAEVLATYVDRYFPAVVHLAGRRGATVGEVLGSTGFPWHSVDEATLAACERALAEHGDEMVATLRRQLADRGDDLRRALAVRRAHDRL